MCALDKILEEVRYFFKGLIEKMMLEERSSYLMEHQETKGNGFYKRSFNSTLGKVRDLTVPRTRDGVFRSSILPKGQSLEEIETLINILFKEGLSTRRIENLLQTCFGTSLSHTTISRLALVAYDEVLKWKNRRLQESYAVVFIDAFYFPLKRDTTQKEAVYVAIGITPIGKREILGFWLPGGSESSLNWGEIFLELKNRGVKNIEIIAADGLTGIVNAIEQQFPDTRYQYCIVHAVRTCVGKVRSNDRTAIAEDLKKLYKDQDSLDSAKEQLEIFVAKWEKRYPKVTTFWQVNFSYLFSFMIFPKGLRKYAYTTNSIERLHKEIKRRLKAMEQFQNEISAEKILYMLYSDQNKRYSKTALPDWSYYYKEYTANKNIDSQRVIELVG